VIAPGLKISLVRVSVVLPVRDAVTTLEACLRSIVRQTLSSWECIVVDDGSTDGSGEILRRAADRDARFRVVSTPPRGLVDALNEGLAQCHGELIARMDGDDVMHRERLRAQVAALDRDDRLAAVGCHVRLLPRRSMMPRLCEYEAWLNGLLSDADVRRDAFVECPVAHPTLMMRRSMASLGYAAREWPEDYDLVLRALAAGLRIGVVPQRLLAWRNGPSTLSRIDPRYGLDRFTACKAAYLASGFLAGQANYVLWGYGRTGRMLHRALARLDKRPTHIVEVKIGRIGQRIHGASVIPHAGLRTLAGQRIVVSVARDGPRREIRGVLGEMGFVDGVDFVCAA
jgi:glycosyltransferase involved in cell wall biosynthesis